ncbi:hypothetical protein [Shinella sumterensis]|uniref:Rv0623-like transcription factor n=1 Tax=Shinella sumterensis TaxID=1967501 RepID=A0AA50HBH6_9HYPH|nr:hypothetical protein [Shinella sumterensis]WLS01117.1 hypothetical protein Q9313_27440 [Shinella sumterensis]
MVSNRSAGTSLVDGVLHLYFRRKMNYMWLIHLRETMLHLTHDTEQLARKVAARAGRRPEDLIRAALEREARELGVYTDQPARRRMTVEQMMAVGKKVSSLPLLDPRSPKEILDDLNEQ